MELNVKITKILNQEKMKALATVSFNGEFLITGVKVLESKHGLYLGMPRLRKRTGEFKDVCFPITKDMRLEITEAVLAAYEKAREVEKSES